MLAVLETLKLGAPLTTEANAEDCSSAARF